MRRKWTNTQNQKLISNYQLPMCELQTLFPDFTYNAIKSHINDLGFKRRPNIGLKRDFFTKIDSPEKAYLLGVLEAEGSIGKNKIILSLGNKELDWITSLRNLTGSQATIGINNSSLGWGYRVDFCSKQWVSDLKCLGFRSNKIPQLSKSLYGWWLRGLFDGDGTICWDKYNGCWISSFYGNINLMKEVSMQLNCDNFKTNARQGATCGVIKLHRLPTLHLSSVLPDAYFCLQRKSRMMKEAKQYNHLKKKARIKAYEQKVYEE